jgi:hypothetical protein
MRVVVKNCTRTLHPRRGKAQDEAVSQLEAQTLRHRMEQRNNQHHRNESALDGHLKVKASQYKIQKNNAQQRRPKNPNKNVGSLGRQATLTWTK